MSSPRLQPPVLPAHIPNRGRALIATRKIAPGEVILTDSPIITYPSSYPSPSICPACLRSLYNLNPIPCPNADHRCKSLFCSAACLSSHSATLCRSLSSFPSLSSDSLFLLHAHSLSLSSPSDFSLLLSLHRSHASDLSVPRSIPFSEEESRLLLSIDRLNAFAIMDPWEEGKEGERRVRGYGIYPKAAMFNHDCLPNACRFDYEGKKEIVVRAVHEISEGREACLSYFPVNWRYKERQERLREDYGFECSCDRCMIEKDWKDEDEENGDDDVMEEEDEDEDEEGDFPHQFYFIKYLCDRENCGGTLAPLPPCGGVVSDVLECNVCGRMKKEDEDDFDESVDSMNDDA